MNKKLSIIAITLFVLCCFRGIYVEHEAKNWEQYVKTSYDLDSLVYAYRSKDYNDLYEMVIVNEIVGEVERDELYDFAHYYNNLCLAHKNYLTGKDYLQYLNKANDYLSKIETKDILFSVEELNNIYLFN